MPQKISFYTDSLNAGRPRSSAKYSPSPWCLSFQGCQTRVDGFHQRTSKSLTAYSLLISFTVSLFNHAFQCYDLTMAFCKFCQEIPASSFNPVPDDFFDPGGRKHGYVHDTPTGLRQSVAEGCPLCYILTRQLRDGWLPSLTKDYNLQGTGRFMLNFRVMKDVLKSRRKKICCFVQMG